MCVCGAACCCPAGTDLRAAKAYGPSTTGCNTPCAGDATATCGGAAAISLVRGCGSCCYASPVAAAYLLLGSLDQLLVVHPSTHCGSMSSLTWQRIAALPCLDLNTTTYALPHDAACFPLTPSLHLLTYLAHLHTDSRPHPPAAPAPARGSSPLHQHRQHRRPAGLLR